MQIFRPSLNALALAVAALSCSVGAAQAAEYQYHHRVAGLKVEKQQAWSLAAAELPEARVGQSYSFSFAHLISDPSLSGFTWNTADLPSWAQLNGQSGQLSGTPSGEDIGSRQFTVVATRQGVNGEQIYTIVVGDQVLEVTQIAPGTYHTCAITPAGGATCWGQNAKGQLGDGSTSDRTTPRSVSGLTSGVLSIFSGRYHSCALLVGGAVKCWGQNTYGEVGDGSGAMRTIPSQVAGLSSGVVSIEGGDQHTCALTAAGAVKCWGYNYRGQLGDGSTVNRSTPVQVAGLTSGVVSIGAGYHNGCAVMSGGALRCWGFNDSGQVGDGTTVNRFTPVAVSGLSSGVASVSVGNYHTCAKLTSSEARCWGRNTYGQVGDGSTTNRLTPVPVYGLGREVSKIASGAYHSCIVTTSGAARCWGQNTYGQMGNGTDTHLTTPGPVSGLDSNVSAIATGYYHNCVTTTSGSAKCWGYNAQGQVGDGTKTLRLTPVDVKPAI